MYDISVFGAGIFGLSVAWACLNRGARVQIIDPNGVGTGASGGVVGALAPHVPENWNPKKAFQLESLLMAPAWWREVQAASGMDPLFSRSGRLQPITDEAALTLAQARAASAHQLWEGQAEWRVTPASGAPWEPQSPSGWLVHDTLSAHLHPAAACRALARACQNRGAHLAASAQTQGIEVWASGAAGLLALGQDLDRDMGQPIKGQAALLKADQAGLPQIFGEGVHIIPHLDGTVAVGSTTERVFTDLNPDDKLEPILATARHLVPALEQAPVIQRWAGARPRARSRAPLLGAHPTRPSVYIANGGFKIGFGMAPKVGDVLADLILEGKDAIPEEFKCKI